ncbi:hypothetical protein KAFR_0A05050 [Kazachstania africana CBS 2517]|uniref:DNA ligase n=1 Tax=Kazachstania africana (strain ATCC 22294 / BCRC 22015 / CBS 2517 / CECT 1963 / NBRC 1671 / NRRL Y-8276) TaxID=1071382 RepID=H2ANJ1_KAZAF|nr:hypothetical protein KAFR_0A05050 [Kazachstania africana CBS 2517]CCF55941.1 hypothetical protein KAFR_0A05050 [Kazachstania africana CBS 2517]
MDLTVPEVEVPRNFAPSPQFKWLCEELFSKLEEVPNQRHLTTKRITLRYYEIITNFVNLWRTTVGDDIYPALILALPYRDRRMYNVKDYTLIKAICTYLKLPKNSFTEKRLLNWKQRADRSVKLSVSCVNEMRKRKSEPVEKSPITLDELNTLLDFLSQDRNIKGRGYKNLSESSIFTYCIEKMSFMELRYFFDIILKARVIGPHEHKLLNAWHPDAEDYLSVVSDLKTVCTRLWNPNIRLRHDELSINIGYAFAPHLAKKLSISYDKICKKLKNDFFIEEKMDGERIQIHYMDYGNDIKFLSRRGVDYTYLYGENLSTGTIACYLKLNRDVKECVLDGEMVTYDEDQDILLPFGMVKSAAMNALTKEEISGQDYHPLLMVFDLVFLNGSSLVEFPLYQRKDYLASVLEPYRARVQIVNFTRCSNENIIRKSLEHAISVGSEGIVLKNYNSRYMIGSRNDSWIKIKPEYLEQFGENMDLIVIGRDSAKKDSFYCGLTVLDEEEEKLVEEIDKGVVNLVSDESDYENPENNRHIKKVVSFCMIANGISQNEYKEIYRKTRGFWKKTEEVPPPPELIEFGTQVPMEWIEPEHSVVLEIKARSLDNTESSCKRFKAGCTLYGGYCRRIRDDVDWKSSFSLAELRRDRRIKHYPGTSEKDTLLKSKKRRKKQLLTPLNQNLNPRDIQTTSKIFDGLFFYILSDYFDTNENVRISKDDLQKLLLENGGKISHNIVSKRESKSNLRILCGKYTAECNVLIKRGYDILSPQWVIDCVENKKIVKIEPSHCFSVSDDLMALAMRRVDKYGDSYESLLSVSRLSYILRSSKDISPDLLSPANMSLDFEKVPYFLFWRRKAFVMEHNFDKSSIRETILKIQLYGGKVVKNISECNIVIFPKAEITVIRESMKFIRNTLAKTVSTSVELPMLPRIVSFEWIDASIEKNVQVPEEDYVPM